MLSGCGGREAPRMRLAGVSGLAISPLTRKHLRKAVRNARRPLFDPDVWPLCSPQDASTHQSQSPAQEEKVEPSLVAWEA